MQDLEIFEKVQIQALPLRYISLTQGMRMSLIKSYYVTNLLNH